MAPERTLFALEITSRGRVIDTPREILQRIAMKSDPQNMRMLQIRKSAHAGCLDFKGRDACRDGRELRLECVDFIEGNGGSEEFQRQVKVCG